MLELQTLDLSYNLIQQDYREVLVNSLPTPDSAHLDKLIGISVLLLSHNMLYQARMALSLSSLEFFSLFPLLYVLTLFCSFFWTVESVQLPPANHTKLLPFHTSCFSSLLSFSFACFCFSPIFLIKIISGSLVQQPEFVL